MYGIAVLGLRRVGDDISSDLQRLAQAGALDKPYGGLGDLTRSSLQSEVYSRVLALPAPFLKGRWGGYRQPYTGCPGPSIGSRPRLRPAWKRVEKRPGEEHHV